MRIILASGSPRRRELLRQIGVDFEVVVSDVEETVTDTDPARIVESLSRQKAEAVWRQLQGETGELVVIGADTVVTLEGRILGKPVDAEDAKAMLRSLAGRSHRVFTGVTLVVQGEPWQLITFHEETRVDFYPMREAEIEEYVATGEPLDKAGAYGIQGVFARYIRGIEGDYFNVVGLPLGRLYRELSAIRGIETRDLQRNSFCR